MILLKYANKCPLYHFDKSPYILMRDYEAGYPIVEQMHLYVKRTTHSQLIHIYLFRKLRGNMKRCIFKCKDNLLQSMISSKRIFFILENLSV